VPDEPLDALLDEDESAVEPEALLLLTDEVVDALSPPDDDPDEPDDPPSALDPDDSPSFFEPPSPLAFETPGVAVARRSFFAQPEPLKWIAGAANAFLSGPPPHSGQTVGSGEWTPRRTSDRRPQFAQS
jgi:hypothetical protein